MHLNNIVYTISSEIAESWIWTSSIYLARYRRKIDWILDVPKMILDRVWEQI